MIKQMIDSSNEKQVQNKSTVIISEGLSESHQSVPNSAVIRSPFKKQESNDSQNPKSPDRVSMDSVKSDSSVWKVDKFVPKQFINQKKVERREATFKLIKFDWQEINSCGAYFRFVTIISCFIIVFIIILDLSLAERQENELISEMKSNQSLEKEIIKPISEVMERHSKYYFGILCTISIFAETLILVVYALHIVENFPTFPWLLVESIYTTGCAVQYYPISIWVAFYGFWLFVVAIFGVIIAIIYTVWAIIKINRYCKGMIPQHPTDDPDGNILRRMSPNLKFSEPKADQFRNKLRNEKKFQENEDIVN